MTPSRAVFTPSGGEKHSRERPPGVRPTAWTLPLDLFDIVTRHGLHFDQSRQVGVVFHMISASPSTAGSG